MSSQNTWGGLTEHFRRLIPRAATDTARDAVAQQAPEAAQRRQNVGVSNAMKLRISRRPSSMPSVQTQS